MLMMTQMLMTRQISDKSQEEQDKCNDKTQYIQHRFVLTTCFINFVKKIFIT